MKRKETGRCARKGQPERARKFTGNEKVKRWSRGGSSCLDCLLVSLSLSVFVCLSLMSLLYSFSPLLSTLSLLTLSTVSVLSLSCSFLLLYNYQREKRETTGAVDLGKGRKSGSQRWLGAACWVGSGLGLAGGVAGTASGGWQRVKIPGSSLVHGPWFHPVTGT